MLMMLPRSTGVLGWGCKRTLWVVDCCTWAVNHSSAEYSLMNAASQLTVGNTNFIQLAYLITATCTVRQMVCVKLKNRPPSQIVLPLTSSWCSCRIPTRYNGQTRDTGRSCFRTRVPRFRYTWSSRGLVG